MRILMLTALLGYSITVSADSIRFGKHLVTDGDSEGGVREAAGAPARVVTLVNEDNLPVGERWVYYVDNYHVKKTVYINFADGEVVSIKEIRD